MSNYSDCINMIRRDLVDSNYKIDGAISDKVQLHNRLEDILKKEDYKADSISDELHIAKLKKVIEKSISHSVNSKTII